MSGRALQEILCPTQNHAAIRGYHLHTHRTKTTKRRRQVPEALHRLQRQAAIFSARPCHGQLSPGLRSAVYREQHRLPAHDIVHTIRISGAHRISPVQKLILPRSHRFQPNHGNRRLQILRRLIPSAMRHLQYTLFRQMVHGKGRFVNDSPGAAAPHPPYSTRDYSHPGQDQGNE